MITKTGSDIINAAAGIIPTRSFAGEELGRRGSLYARMTDEQRERFDRHDRRGQTAGHIGLGAGAALGLLKGRSVGRGIVGGVAGYGLASMPFGIRRRRVEKEVENS